METYVIGVVKMLREPKWEFDVHDTLEMSRDELDELIRQSSHDVHDSGLIIDLADPGLDE
jgi:hypothetical protein